MLNKLFSDRQKIKDFVETRKFDMFIMMLICLNSVVLGLMTMPVYKNFYPILKLLDIFCLSIFIVEMLLKLCAYGRSFFDSRWNTFDLTIVALSSFSFATPFIIFRAFRLFRILKYINRFSRLKRIIGISRALLPNFSAFFLVFAVFIYVFAIIAVNLFSARILDFANLSQALLTLLQVFTLDGWAKITRSVMGVYPHAWLFFISYIMLSLMLLLSFILSLVDEIVKRELYMRERAARLNYKKVPFKKKNNASK